MKTVYVFLFSLFLGGCASTFQSISKDPMRITNIEANDVEIMSVASFDATRRNMVVITDGSKKGKFCAEPSVDVALNVKTDASLTASNKSTVGDKKSNDTSATVGEKYEDTITVLSKRTALVEIYKAGTFNLCQYFLNDAITSEALTEQFESLTDMVIEAYIETVPSNPEELGVADPD